jgi:DedD protein
VESRIKERLTGALILVAALVILVPEIFSGRRAAEPATDPVAIAANEQPPLRSYTSELDAAAPPPVAAAVTEQAPDAAPAEQAAAEPERVAQDVVDPPPVRETAPTPASSPPPAAPPARGDWFVQVGSFSQAANAQRYAQQLRNQGHAVIVLPPAGAKALSRVRVGPVRTREAAGELLARLQAAGHKGAVVGP